MKSRTSSSKFAAFRKDITRFAPAWVLYAVFLLMCLLLLKTGNHTAYAYSTALVESISLMAIANLCYALLCGQLLFGDLFNSRMCNALHAMPLRRGSWFWTHVLSGLCFSFAPNLLFAAVNCLILGEHWILAAYWLLAVSLQYLFFFGLAVFSALCVGNRFAMVLVYGILNFLSILVLWLVTALYMPLLYGVQLDSEPFLLFCPVEQMYSCCLVKIEMAGEMISPQFTIALLEDWWYLWVCAGIGLIFLVLALLLYRRRKLECAGDFMAEPKMAPVFLVIYSLMVGTVFQVFSDLFAGGGIDYLFLGIGLAVGFFTGQMLLKRTARVFRPKILLGFAVLAVVLALSLGVTAMDPMGVTRWVPEAKDVASVSITPYYSNQTYPLESADDIENILKIHQAALADRESQGSTVTFTLTYTLKSGAKVQRYYGLPVDGESGRLLRQFFSRPECVFGPEIADFSGFLDGIQEVHIEGERYASLLDRADVQSLVDAMLLDCQAGNMAQDWSFHDDETLLYWVGVPLSTVNANGNWYLDIRIYESCENTLAWLEEHSELFELYDEYYG